MKEKEDEVQVLKKEITKLGDTAKKERKRRIRIEDTTKQMAIAFDNEKEDLQRMHFAEVEGQTKKHERVLRESVEAKTAGLEELSKTNKENGIKSDSCGAGQRIKESQTSRTRKGYIEPAVRVRTAAMCCVAGESDRWCARRSQGHAGPFYT